MAEGDLPGSEAVLCAPVKMKKTDVSVVIVSYNTKDLLRRSLLSLAKGLDGTEYEVWVVDNASSDGSQDMVRLEFPAVNLIANIENLGFAKANNQALRKMRGSYALLLNSDAMLEPLAGKQLLDFLKATPAAGMAGPALLDGERRISPSTYPLPGFWVEFIKAFKLYRLLPAATMSRTLLGSFFDHRSTLRAGRLTGACVMVPKTAIDLAGFICEDFFFYGEIHDWCWTMKEKGLEVWFYPAAAAIHLGGQSSSQKWDKLGTAAASLEAVDRMLKRHMPPLKIKILYGVALIGDTLSLFRRRLSGGTDNSNEAERLKAEADWYYSRLFG